MKTPRFLTLVAISALVLSHPALAGTRTWTGGAVSNDFWSDADNWSGGIAPVQFDSLIFPTGIQGTDLTMRNNLDGVFFQSLRFDGNGYVVNGDIVNIMGGITNGVGLAPDVVFKTSIRLGADQTFALNAGADLTIESPADLLLNGSAWTISGPTGFWTMRIEDDISGGGSIFVRNSARLIISRTTTTPAPFTAEDGGDILLTDLNAGVGHTFGTLGSTAGSTTVRNGGSVTFQPFDDQTVSETLHLDGGGAIRTAVSEENSNSVTLTLAGPIVLGGAGTRSIYCHFSTGTGAVTTRITSRISGSGDLLKDGPLTLFLEGSQSNTFSGSFTAQSGLTVLAKPTGVAALACADVTVINAGIRLDANEQIADTTRLHLGSNGTLSLNGKTETVASLEMAGGIASGNSPSLLNVTGNVTSLASADSGQVNVNTQVRGTPTVLDVQDGAAADDLIFSVSLNCVAGGSLRKTGAGRAVIAELTGNRPVEIQDGALVLGSAAGSAVTLNGGTLTGASNVGTLTSAAGGGTIAPGTGIGTISCTTLALNAATTFTVEIQSMSPGGFDVLDANVSTVNLGGATLAVTLLPGFDGGIGTPITILDNDGTDPIVGTFAGLPENAEIVTGGAHFRISYIGGTGNDVTLTLTSVPPTFVTRTWTGNAANGNTDQAGNWNPVAVPQLGDTLLFPAGPTHKTVVDNIAGITPYNKLQFDASGYTVSGTGIVLLTGINATYASGTTLFQMPLQLSANLAFVAGGGAKLTISGPGITAVNLDGHALTINAGTGSTMDIGEDAGPLGPSDGIHGSGSVTKIGAGTLTMWCFNSYTGATSIQAGTVEVLDNDALGAIGPGNGTSVASGTTLVLGRAEGFLKFFAEDLILDGSLISRSFAGTTDINVILGTLTVALPDRHISVEAGTLAIRCIVQGAGGLFKQGAGDLIIGGTAANTFTGRVVVSQGVLSLQKPAGVAASAANFLVVAGELRLGASDQIISGVEVDGPGIFNLNGFNETLPSMTLGGGTVQGAGTLTLAGPLTLTGNALTSTLAANVAISGASQTWTVPDGTPATDLAVSGAVSGVALVKTGSGRVLFSGTNTLGSLDLQNGSALFNGNSVPTAIALNGGTLGGSGTVGAITSSATGGTVAPGSSAGILNSGAVTWNAATHFAVELTTPVPGSGHDQLNVTGAVNLGGAQLDVTLLAGFAATPADTFVIINNDGADAVIGTFAGLPQNATFSVAGKSFRISYTGGSGNDVTLKLFTLGTGVTKTWDGGGANDNWNTAANWVGDVAPVAGDDLVFPQSAARKTNVNNFAANTTFNSIKLTGNGYSVSGAAVTVNDGITFDYASGASSCLLSIICSQAETFAALNGANGTISPAVSLNNGGFSVTLLAEPAASRLIVSGILGSGALTKVGAGGVTLSNNTFTGATSILAGEVLLAASATGLGDTAAGTTIAPGASLKLSAVPAGTFAEPITIGGSLVCASSPVTFTGAIVLTGTDAAAIDVSGLAPTISGVISGAAGLRKTGGGTLILAGTASNTFAGGLFVDAGAVHLQKTAGLNAAPGPVTIGDGTATAAELRLLAANQVPTIAITLNGAGAIFNLNGQAETIGNLVMTGGTVNTNGATLNFSGNITTFASATSATITGNITSTAGGLRAWAIEDGAAADDLVTTGTIAGPAGITIVKSGDGRVVFGGSSNFTKLRLDFGTASFTGTSAGVAVDLGPFGNDEAVLTGSGITGPVTTPSIVAGKIAPAGILTASGNTSWNAETRLQISLLNTTPGTGHDQYFVLGTPTLGGAQLELTAQPGFAPTFGDTFKILDNSGAADPVVGTFAGLPEGTLIDVSGVMMRISYTGGDGNDVTLTVANLPATNVTRVWDGGSLFDSNWTTPANWVGDVAPVAGDALEFPESAARKSNTNNFPANTTFQSIRISGTATRSTARMRSCSTQASAPRRPRASPLSIRRSCSRRRRAFWSSMARGWICKPALPSTPTARRSRSTPRISAQASRRKPCAVWSAARDRS